MASHPWTTIDPGTGRYMRTLSEDERSVNRKSSYKRYRKSLSALRNLQANHGLSLEAAKAVYDSKPAVCDICRNKRKLCYDHDHSTGEHRGWLCNYCNHSLKMVEDPARLEAALRYLGRTS